MSGNLTRISDKLSKVAVFLMEKDTYLQISQFSELVLLLISVASPVNYRSLCINWRLLIDRKYNSSNKRTLGTHFKFNPEIYIS